MLYTNSYVFKPLECVKIKNKSRYLNDIYFLDYYYRLKNIAMSMFKWENVPDTIDIRFLEETLFERGVAILFEDEYIGALCLPVLTNGEFNIYRLPKRRRAYAINGYQKELDENNSIWLFNNYLRLPTANTIFIYAKQLAEIRRTMEVNINAQKTPITILCDENERLTYKNIYEKYDGNAPMILGAKNLDLNNIKALSTQAPYVADRLYELFEKTMCEALSYLGVENAREKNERMTSEEISYNMGSTQAQRYVWLNSRRQACEEFNKMFGFDMWVDFQQTALGNPFDATTLNPEIVEDISISPARGGENG